MIRRPPTSTLFPYTARFPSPPPRPAPRAVTFSIPLLELDDLIHRRRGDDLLPGAAGPADAAGLDRKSTRLNSTHANISYADFCLKKKHQPTQIGIAHVLSPV